MEKLSTRLKSSREKAGLLIREAAQQLDIDATLMSRYESGNRIPSKKTLHALANLYKEDEATLTVLWLSEKILKEIEGEASGLDALLLAEEHIKYSSKVKKAPVGKGIKALLKEIDTLKAELNKYRKFDSYRIAQALELEYTFESNRIEGNTLTLKETDLVINEGITIAGKSMREHLEAINHKEAIAFVKHLAEDQAALSERNVLSIHNLVLRGIDPENAGAYRKLQVMIKGSRHMPPQPYILAKAMEDYFIWYRDNKRALHPVLLAAEMHERLVTIHPFIDGNGRTARLVMNMILLQSGYVIANIKGDQKNRMMYYDALEKVQVDNDKEAFLEFVAVTERDALSRYLKVIKVK